ncbi:hypothetical protein AB0D47_02500 [Streptomyces sp. NPDC048376]|uniref:hypothetical protein n=1 Tax=Streptomyces sp. NPDC048376 TaxID=3154926 RepID=UPI00343D88F3
MKVRMLVAVSGTRNGARWPDRGKTVDLPADEALRLVASGLAEKVTESGLPVETATLPPPEVTTPPAAKSPSRRRGRADKGETAKE